MTLLIACLLIYHFHLHWGWYVVAVVVEWVDSVAEDHWGRQVQRTILRAVERCEARLSALDDN